jgi:hypothetical protein
VREPFTALLLNRYRPDAVFSPMQTIGRSAAASADPHPARHDLLPAPHAAADLPWYVRSAGACSTSLRSAAAHARRRRLVATVSETSAAEFARVRLTKRPVVVVPNAPQRLAELLPAGGGSSPAPRTSSTWARSCRTRTSRPHPRHGGPPGRTLHLLSRISPARRAELERLVDDGGGRCASTAA